MLEDVSDASGRLALLRATIVIVSQGGLRALTYRAIAAEAAVSHGLVRHHFGTRDQLIAEAMDFAIEERLRGSNMLVAGLTESEFAAGIESLAERQSDVQAFQYELLLERLGVTDAGLAELICFTLDGMVFKQLVQPGDVEAVLGCILKLVEAAATRRDPRP